jgi:hypothetical protein
MIIIAVSARLSNAKAHHRRVARRSPALRGQAQNIGKAAPASLPGEGVVLQACRPPARLGAIAGRCPGVKVYLIRGRLAALVTPRLAPFDQPGLLRLLLQSWHWVLVLEHVGIGVVGRMAVTDWMRSQYWMRLKSFGFYRRRRCGILHPQAAMMLGRRLPGLPGAGNGCPLPGIHGHA